MTNTSKSIKKDAQKIIFSNVITTFFSGMIILSAFFIFNFSASLFSFAELFGFGNTVFLIMLIFLFIPLCLGLLRFMSRMTLDLKDNPIILLYYFSSKKNYLRTLKFIFSLFGKVLLRAFLVFMPSIIIKIMTMDSIYTKLNISTPIWRGYLDTLYNGFFTLGLILIFLYMIKFYLSPFLFISNDNIDVGEAFLMSKIISKKSSLDFIYLVSSFIVWFFLSLFFIPMIYTIPYFAISYIIHSKHSIDEYNNHIEISKQNFFDDYHEGI